MSFVVNVSLLNYRARQRGACMASQGGGGGKRETGPARLREDQASPRRRVILMGAYPLLT